MKVVNLRLTSELNAQVDKMCELKGFKNRSEYIRDLISRDTVFGMGNDLDERLKGFKTEIQNSSKRGRQEILQRIFILTQIVLLEFKQPPSGRISEDQLQRFIDDVIKAAEKKYPIN